MKRKLLRDVLPAKRQKTHDDNLGDKINIDIIEQFEHNVNLYPDKIAICYTETKISYYEFNERINQLAGWMLRYHSNLFFSQENNNSQAHIGIRGANKLQIIISQLACLKIGATYVVIDKDEPEERASFIAQDAALDLIINCDEGMEPIKLLDNCTTVQISLSDIQEQIKNQVKENLPNQIKQQLTISPNNLAYYIYTSGSTGQPKGVMQSRQGLLGQMKYYSEGIGLNADDIFLGISPLTHDQGISNVYASLLTGCTFCIFDLVGNNFQAVAEYIEDNKITVYVSVPTVWEQIGEIATKQSLSSIKIVRLGGEEPKIKHARLYQEKCSATTQFITAFGASECSFMALNSITQATNLDSLIPMGRFLPHIKYQFKPVAECGEGGMLAISSPYMAKGYTRAEENQKVYSDGYYLTGDIVSMKENVLNFVGREAWHEKILGNLVNLHGIAQTIEAHISINQAISGCECVVVTIGEGDQKSLIAFITGKDKASINIEKLKRQLNASLEFFAIPRKIELIESFPLLTNKKIDRKTIQQMAENSFAFRKEELFSKICTLQNLLDYMSEIWCFMLNLPPPFSVENKAVCFHQLGGDSACSMQTSKFINEIIHRCIFKKDSNKDVEYLISPLDVHAHSLTKFNKLVYTKINNYLADYKDGKYLAIHNTIPFAVVAPAQGQWEGTGDVVQYANHYALSLMNVHAMHNLINYSCHQYAIDIKLCANRDALLKRIEQIVKEGKRKQYGFIVSAGYNYIPEYHCFPCIFVYSTVLDKWCLFIADSQGMWSGMESAKKIKRALEASFEDIQINIYVDPIGRQGDSESCNVDAVCYLENGLRLPDFMDSVYIVNNKIVKEGHYLFLSPPVCMQVYQNRWYSYDYAVDEILDNYSSIETKERERLKNTFIRHALELIHANIEQVQKKEGPYVLRRRGSVSLCQSEAGENVKNNQMFLQEYQEGFLVRWAGETEYLKYERLPYEVLQSIPQLSKTYYESNILYDQLIMLANRGDVFGSTHRSIFSNSKKLNTYYYKNVEKLYKICIYGAQLIKLDAQLTEYLNVLNKEQASTKMPTLFNAPVSVEKNIVLQDTIDTIKYLSVLFGFNEDNSYTKRDSATYGKILFGDKQAPNKKLIDILNGFIQSLDGRYLFNRCRVEINNNDLKSFINLLEKDYQTKHSLPQIERNEAFTILR